MKSKKKYILFECDLCDSDYEDDVCQLRISVPDNKYTPLHDIPTLCPFSGGNNAEKAEWKRKPDIHSSQEGNKKLEKKIKDLKRSE